MSYEKVMQANTFIVGTKQTVKALKTGTVQEVVIAEDADVMVTQKVIQVANESNTPVSKVDSMKNSEKHAELK